MFTNKKVTPIFSAALSLALLASGTYSLGNEAYAADLNESQKSQLETSYFSNNVSNKASRMLLEEYPNLASGSESQLKDLVNKSDDVIKKTKPVVEKLHPERAN
ncbi:MAG: hypothetical protein E7H32_04490 [Anaerococcus sp.]|nr:hypothetical protein [Anaerococcus sp.]MDU4025928.1 hypothetical protein [Anaerococcus sp.]